MRRSLVSAQTCPRCETRRLGAFRFCQTCGLDYDASAPGTGPAAEPAAVGNGPAARESIAAPAAADSAGRAASPVHNAPEGVIVGHLLLLAGTCLAASLTMATVDVAIPQAVRIVLAGLIVFILPGFAVVCAVLPARQLSSGERLVASLGISLVIATILAVLLGATPIGLSRTSFAVALGCSTIALSVVASFRALIGIRWRAATRAG